ncbi:MAG: MGMT family protein, partial [Muribaculaceae bacterium]|nr:MGMT family protein [Muribaculaceae bacterium]
RVRFEDSGLSLDRVSNFTKAVLLAVMEIEWGTTISYRGLADRIGRPNAVRAVASALGRNPYPFLIPCHRVVASDGSLGGYAWGRELKAELLAYEGVILKFQ